MGEAWGYDSVGICRGGSILYPFPEAMGPDGHFKVLMAETDVLAPPKEKKKKRRKEETRTLEIPRYHVVLLDDDEHTYEYVIEMLMDLFGHSMQKAFRMACEVDLRGRVIVETTHRERAELKRDQIHAYGADWRIPQCKGSMSARIEPAS